MTYLEAGIEVLKIIEMNGYEAFFVGGFVRDRILGVESNDIDITTNALPSQIANVFKVIILVSPLQLNPKSYLLCVT